MSRVSMSRPEPKHPIGSVDKALRLLLMFRDTREIRISEASRELEVVPSTAHRLMAMLDYYGFVIQNSSTRAYQAGPLLTELGLRALRNMDSREHVRAMIVRLSSEVAETVHFQILESGSTFFVDGVESDKPVRTTLRIGDRLPAHCTSGGKAMLAELSSEELRAALPGRRLSSCTGRSITSFKDLQAELEQVRSRGYAVSIGESEPDIAALGTVVRDPDGRMLGAFSISMPLSRFDEKNLPDLVAKLQAAATDVRGG